MDHEIKRLGSIECAERLSDFLLGIFSGGVERGGIAVAEAGPVRSAERSHLPVKINEAVATAEGARLLRGFVIARQDPNAFAQRFKQLAGTLKPPAKHRKVSSGNVQVSGPSEESFERSRVSVDVAEN